MKIIVQLQSDWHGGPLRPHQRDVSGHLQDLQRGTPVLTHWQRHRRSDVLRARN